MFWKKTAAPPQRVRRATRAIRKGRAKATVLTALLDGRKAAFATACITPTKTSHRRYCPMTLATSKKNVCSKVQGCAGNDKNLVFARPPVLSAARVEPGRGSEIRKQPEQYIVTLRPLPGAYWAPPIQRLKGFLKCARRGGVNARWPCPVFLRGRRPRLALLASARSSHNPRTQRHRA